MWKNQTLGAIEFWLITLKKSSSYQTYNMLELIKWAKFSFCILLKSQSNLPLFKCWKTWDFLMSPSFLVHCRDLIFTSDTHLWHIFHILKFRYDITLGGYIMFVKFQACTNIIRWTNMVFKWIKYGIYLIFLLGIVLHLNGCKVV